MQNYTGWKNLPTRQSKEILHELSLGKEHQRALLLISDTGLGKSNTIKLFCDHETLGLHTYSVVAGDSYKVGDVVDAILSKLSIVWRQKATGVQKLELIAEALAGIRQQGGNPIIIIDEAENLKPATLKRIKELYDAIIAHCSIVLIGTNQILDSIHNTRNKNRQSVPQLWRRFKAGVRYITPLSKAKDFEPFFNLYIPGAADLHDLLIEKADNYGELHDFLHPVLLHAAKTNQPVTEEIFRQFHNIKSNKLKKVS